MTGYADTGEPGDGELLFLPLGGTGEIGMNLNLYGHAGKWLMVDLGITFGDDTTPGVEVITPDPAFIEERREDLVGLVLTHAHEDHLGAVPYLWRRLRCPIYATPFTANFLRHKLAEADLLQEVPLHEVPLSGRFSVAPFDLELITLTHSIPEPNALVVRTPAGRVLHTGDWKLDPDPVIGPTTDEAALIRAGEEGIDAMVCDSTNAMVEGSSGSEGDVYENLLRIAENCEQRVAVACFASNVARLETVAKVGHALGRDVALVGRSLWRVYAAARASGYLGHLPPFVSEEHVGFLPRERTLIICTGSQGEPRAALPRIAGGGHPHVSLDAGDTVVFSSRKIPGNEQAIGRLQNRLVERGIAVVSGDRAGVHVSGHPARDELAQMYRWVRPRVAVPVHGEPRHLAAHAKLALECQVPRAITIANGSVVRIAPGEAAVIDEVFSGRLAVDGNRLIALEGPVLRQRRKMAWNGAMAVAMAMDRKGRVAGDARI
ncbi:MAG: ribonuclease J, partial [Acetobacteraceae bacterium]